MDISQLRTYSLAIAIKGFCVIAERFSVSEDPAFQPEGAFMQKKNIVALLLVILVIAPARAAESCSNATLHGGYAYSASGFVAQTAGQGPYTPIAESGTYTFDGSGAV